MIRSSPRGLRTVKHCWYGVFIALLILLILGIVYMFLRRSEHFQDAQEKVTVKYYYLKDCPYCVKFNPEWDSFASQMGQSINLVKIDGDKEDVPSYVKGFPFIEISIGSQLPKEYTGERTAEEMVKYVNNYKG